MHTRRDVLRSVGTLAAGTTVAVTASTAAAARASLIPEHVSLTYDEDWLSTYQPELAMGETAREKLYGIYAWRATSTEADTDVGVYFASYSHQEGASSFTSHYGDREPVYVFVDSESGDVTRIMASVYHWMKDETTPDTLSTNGTHVRLSTISPWHHHTAATENDETKLHPLKKLGDEAGLNDDDVLTTFEGWLRNGLDEDLGRGTVVRPWMMKTRESWWQEGRFGISTTALYVSLRRDLGVGVAGSLS